MSKIMTWHVYMVTILRRNVSVVCGASYHLLGYRISQDSKIQFRLQVESYISNWLFSEPRLLASYVSRHKAMAYDKWCVAMVILLCYCRACLNLIHWMFEMSGSIKRLGLALWLALRFITLTPDMRNLRFMATVVYNLSLHCMGLWYLSSQPSLCSELAEQLQSQSLYLVETWPPLGQHDLPY